LEEEKGEGKVTRVNDNFSPGMFDHGKAPLQGGESSGQEKVHVS